MSSDALGEKVLWTQNQIQQRVSEMARDISATMGEGTLSCLVVLRGGFFFAADLIRQLTGFERIEVDFVRLSSYQGMVSSGAVKFRGTLPQVAGRNVLVIEDLLDTGLTLKVLSEALSASGARSVRYAVLVDKKARRQHTLVPDYVAFKLDTDDYLYGYGMDLDGGRRELPYIAAVHERPKRKRPDDARSTDARSTVRSVPSKRKPTSKG